MFLSKFEIYNKAKEKVQNIAGAVENKVADAWDSTKSFFGFGEDAPAEIDVNLNKKVDGKVISTGTDPSGLLLNPTGTPVASKITNGISGGEGAGKSITMNLDIKNYFNMQAGNWKDSADEIVDVIVGKINDRMRDAVIAIEQ